MKPKRDPIGDLLLLLRPKETADSVKRVVYSMIVETALIALALVVGLGALLFIAVGVLS